MTHAHRPAKLRIGRISRDGTTKKNKSPDKSFTANDRYTITLPNGERNLVVEHTLGNLENNFVQVLSRIRRRDKLNAFDRAQLCLFAAAMQSRTVAMGDHWKKHLQEVHDKVVALEQAHNAPPITSLQTAEEVEHAHQDLVMVSLQTQTPLYFTMQMSVFVADDELGFITSDTPCVWFNPKAHTFPPLYRSPGLAQEEIEVTLPLTPQHLLFISHREHPFYLDVGRKAVDEANRLTRWYCNEEFISWKGETRPYWFERGKQPTDAWENTEEVKKALQQQAEWEKIHRKQWEQQEDKTTTT